MSGYAVARIEQIDEIQDGRSPWRPVRHHFGVTSFGINAFTARETGDRIINEHDEVDDEGDAHEELYLVQSGRARFELDGEQVDAPAGTFVYAPPSVKRTAFAEEPGTTIVAMGGTPGKAYHVRGWEIWAPLQPLYEAGEYAEVADRGRELIEAHPELPLLNYNLACCESLAGRSGDAVKHLRQAIEQREELRSLATEDSDLDAIREEPGFKELIAG
jgi:tetratricopeptide (TPR) repeat protein